jgi:hypothetical protein
MQSAEANHITTLKIKIVHKIENLKPTCESGYFL